MLGGNFRDFLKRDSILIVLECKYFKKVDGNKKQLHWFDVADSPGAQKSSKARYPAREEHRMRDKMSLPHENINLTTQIAQVLS